MTEPETDGQGPRAPGIRGRAGAPLPDTRSPVVVRHLGMRSVSLNDVVGAAKLSGAVLDQIVDTQQYGDDVDGGNWRASHGEVWRRAQEIRQLLQGQPNPRLIYAGGMPEVAQAVALGAYLEEHWPVEAYDFCDGLLSWPSEEQTLTLDEPSDLPQDRMPTAGPGILRIEISYQIADEHVREFVPEEERVADVRISPRSSEPRPGLVLSAADVEEVRRAVRAAVFALFERRPRLTVLHLFIAAPVSACIVAGQELRLRNHPPVQTYRHRRGADGTSRITEALLLTASGPTVLEAPLSEEQVQRAAALRQDLWEPAIRDVERYADRRERSAAQTRRAGIRPRWYDGLPLGIELQQFRPFSVLPAVFEVVKRPAIVDPESFDREGFGFQRAERKWRINDGFSVQLGERFPDPVAARALVRIFLFHEYLHEVHGITKESYREVGKFPNALERADYICDLYGILHELDWEVDEDPQLAKDFERLKRRVAGLIDLVLRSFWAFEARPPLDWLEVRRMRRYLNWYWQYTRAPYAESPLQLAMLLARPPIVEIAGLALRAEGRRVNASLQRFDREVGLELCVVLDSERLQRIKTGANTQLELLARAFRQQDHGALQEMFRRVFAEVEQTGQAMPRIEDLA